MAECKFSSRAGMGLRGLWLIFTTVAALRSRADSTWVYTVQINAEVQADPPRIALSWPQDDYGAKSYTIHRKEKSATSWGTGILLPGSATSYTDTGVAAGSTYEYEIVKAGSAGYTGYGYIYAGIEAPLVEDRGTLVLIVDNTQAGALSNELARLQADLVGDGWSVIRHDVPRDDTPSAVRNLIIADYHGDPANVKSVFLFGHVPILQSGNLNYDGHYSRPMPADAYYGDMDGNWNSSPSFLPSDVELMVGRVDLFDMPGNGAPVPWPAEVELLRNYLNKDHAWRNKLMNVPQRALMGDRRGAESGEATAASGYRNFDPLLGHGNTILANAEDAAPPEQRWMSMLAADTYLWAYGCGGGQPTAISHLGTHGQYWDVWSTDVVGQDAKAVFVMLFGSYFGNWDSTDNIMRSFLATPSLGLASCMAGRPHWFMHHMGLGETIGYSTRLSMNNSTLYRNDVNNNTRAVYVALMGDPTLRMYPVAPPQNVSAVMSAGGVLLSWNPSPDGVLGYHVYRSSSATGPFTRMTAQPIAGNSFEDSNVSSGSYTYLVRAIAFQTTPSGTFFNSSEGILTTVSAATPALPILVQAQPGESGVTLLWNSQPGIVYHVLATSSAETPTWQDASGTITAGGTRVSWTDADSVTGSQRFYRVVSP